MAAVRRTQTPPLVQFSSVEEYVEKRKGNRVIKKVLIANNGIAAVKCIRSIRTWSYQTFGDDHAIQFVAMATPEDLHANAEYIRMADQFEEVAGGSNNNNYANVPLIVDIAERTGCDAVWAGWGHASENPNLPSSLLKSNITFIGPGAYAMKELGDKINSTILAQSVNVSVVPWSGSGIIVDYEKEGCIPEDAVTRSMVKDIHQVREAVKHIGYPLMIKASEGGGGKGIRKVTCEEELEASFKSVQGEVPGSPIFLMKLVPNCHHLEVQVVGDVHGNALSIYGRDCSVQRRHQKIIEEGPAIAADPVVWEKMEKAAVRLAAAVGYVGAGTVEYLYADGEYYFLELNPRLQVEHPVSEQISGVNLPATQLNVAMGIPLYNIPSIRRMYGKDPYGLEEIDFNTEKQEPPHGHVIACRITAENPEDGFKPTSGNIQELTFRSTPNVWGYFSIQGLGGLHEFADSQFGHLFAWGNERDEARKNMVIALKEISIRGDIRTPVEYLVTLLETEDFRDLSIHTGWLDERIANPSLIGHVGGDSAHEKSPIIPVLCGVGWKAYHESKSRHNVYMSFIERGQIPPNELLHCTDDIELIYDDVKYLFQVSQFGPTTFFLSINDSHAQIEVIEFSDGGVLVVLDGQSHSVYGKEETEGLRLSIRGKSHLFPREYDPSNLRSTSAGKIIRYLVKDGSQIKAGTPYVEIEVMKMFMIQKVPESGTIHFELAVGTSLSGGETIARLELENPHAIKRSRKFIEKLPPLKLPKPEKTKLHQQLRGVFTHLETVLAGFPSLKLTENVEKLIRIVNDPSLPLLEFTEILSILAGRLPSEVDQQIGKLMKSYELVAVADLDPTVRNTIKFPASAVLKVLDLYAENLAKQNPDDEIAFRNVAAPVETLAKRYERGYLNDIVQEYLKRFLFVENLFQHKQRDEVAAELRQRFKDDPEEIFRISMSRNAQSQSGELILQLLNSVVEEQIEEFVSILHEFATLTGKTCLEISVKARQLLIRYQLPSFKQRQVAIEECLRSALQISTPNGRLEKVNTLIDQSTALFDVLVTFFWHENPQVRDLAVEVYVRRSYSAYYIDRVTGIADNDLHRIEWEFISPDRAPTGALNPATGGLGGSAGSVTPGTSPFSQKNPFHVESVDSLITGSGEGGIDITRYGLMLVFNRIENFFDQFEEILQMFAPPHSHIGNEPINVLNVAIPSKTEGQAEAVFICNVAKFLYDHRNALREVGMRRITILVCKEFKFPKYYTFRERLNYQEDSVNRHVEPPLAYHLELSRLSNFDITYIPTLNRQIHLFYATAKGKRPTDPDYASCFFVRAMVRTGSDAVPEGIVTSSKDYLISQAERVMVDAIKSLEVAVREKRFAGAQNHHIFLKVITEVNYEPESVDVILRTLGETYGRRLWKLRVGKLELSGKVRRGNSVTSLRFTIANPTGYDFVVDGYLEVKDNKTGSTFLSSITGPAPQDQHPVNEPYPLPNRIERKRFLAQNHGTTYCYDFPSLYKAAVRKSWEIYHDQIRARNPSNQSFQLPSKFMEVVELILVDDKLVETDREPGQNTIGMVVWKMKLFTPEAPQGRDTILIANDITIQIGSFGPTEDALFDKASKYARKHGLPRIYISCNSGARIGLATEVKEKFRVKWKNPEEPQKGFDYLYLDEESYQSLNGIQSIRCVGEDHRIADIIGQQDGLGVENLRGSGLIAGETSKAYEEIFTITQVTGRSVGIGAYLVRLGQRTVQTEAPIILTGASAINKLLGKEVYSSNEQLGGIQIMFRNGVSHLDVLDDFRGTLAIVQWLSFVPLQKETPPPVLDYHDPVDRPIEFQPSSTPYNPVHMLAGYTDQSGSWVSGFFDQGSWMETLAGWARTVICGRARLGGIPVGVIAVETRTVENVVPADPANPESQEQVFMQAGQVWFPDSAYKTSQAISDFNYGEELPLIIFANWRGFSGGMRDMYNEILKFGSYIVDNLRKYRHPVFIYIPPNGELRGGAWVVLDPTINSRHIEMYCDEKGRGGVLEPNGTVEIKYRSKDLIQTMHRLDSGLRELDSQLAAEANEEKHSQLRDRIHAREQELLQIYQQVAIQFADLHDTPGRMKAKGVIRDVVEWKTARTYFYYRLKRVLKENSIRDQLLAAQPGMDYDQITSVLVKAVPADVYASDQAFLSWAEEPDRLADAVKLLRDQHIRSQLMALYQLDPKGVETTLRELQKK